MKSSTSAFISEVEKEVVLLRHRGNSFVVIADFLNSTVIQAEKTYREVMAKIKLLQTVVPEDVEHIFPCKTIEVFIDQLGVGSNILGRDELREAIRFSYEHPETLDCIQLKFFPELAEHMNLTEKLVRNRIYRTVKYTYSDRERKGTPAYIFYRRAGLNEQYDINLKRFLLTAHNCILELHVEQSEIM
ncbi:MAG: sporulation initiation factor Spo0A C-terminal domain-containing protein [Lachnospiraceae bacterium]